MATVSLKQLLEAGVHFGHQTQRWNPKMARYIFGERNGIYIIDLEKTLANLGKACAFLKGVARQGGKILFVGTKKQAKEPIETGAKKCGMPFVNQRWLGGMLTNFETVRKSVARLKAIEKMEEEGTFNFITKKEAAHLQKEKAKLEKVLAGVRDMTSLPQAVFVIDPNVEEISVWEATKLGIPVVALIDTNSDPDLIIYPIPGNDDAIRAVKLICEVVTNQILEGRDQYLQSIQASEKPADEPAAAETEKPSEDGPAEDAEKAENAETEEPSAESSGDEEVTEDPTTVIEEKIVEKFGSEEDKARAPKAKVRKGTKSKE
ncbi:MAG TPA: 30S ribosomal protein S2 [Candidatus Omnitrophota bacterium]|nr:30S ribosomal protein S2 [Candidatus Omnitrophota bacterium]